MPYIQKLTKLWLSELHYLAKGQIIGLELRAVSIHCNCVKNRKSNAFMVFWSDSLENLWKRLVEPKVNLARLY